MDHKPAFSHGYGLIIGVGEDLSVKIDDVERGAYEACQSHSAIEEN